MSAESDLRDGADRVLVNPVTGLRLRIVRSTRETAGACLEMEATYPPRSPAPIEHFHPAQDERFVVESGAMTARVGGVPRTLGPGDELAIPALTPHAMWNAGDAPSVVRWTTTPARGTEEFFRDIVWLASEGRIDATGKPRLLDLAWLAPKYWNEMRVTRPPQWAQRLLFAILAPAGALRRRRRGGER